MQLMKNMASDARELTIDQCLDIIPLSFFQYRLLALCGVLFMADAMEVILLSFLTACAGETFNLSDMEMSSITSVVFAGQLIGTCFWGPFADVYGRRTGYLCACAVTSGMFQTLNLYSRRALSACYEDLSVCFNSL